MGCSNPSGGGDVYTVSFDALDGSPTPQDQLVSSGQKAALPSPAPAKEGYILEGWYTEADYAKKWDFAADTVGADLTLYARWKLDVSEDEQKRIDDFKNNETIQEALETDAGEIGLDVPAEDLTGIEAKVADALAAYEQLGAKEQEVLAAEKAKLEATKEKIGNVNDAHEFQDTHEAVLEQNPEDLATLADAETLLPELEQALEGLNKLPDPVKELLAEEVARLEDLKAKAEAIINESGPPPLTGAVSIAGTAKVGEALTINTDSLDGTGGISYQWARGDTADGAFADISGATNETYTLAAEDQGKYIRVTTSRAGYSGTTSSAAAGPVAAADLPALTGTVSITGTAKVGEALTATTGSLGGTGTISYQWGQGDTVSGTFADISGATNETYTPMATDQGKYLRVMASRAGYSGTTSSAAVGPVAAADLPALTGTVGVTGTAKVGETLTANTGSLGGTGAISHQWERSNTATGGFTTINGATGASYTLVAADSGKYIRVTASRAGYSGTVSSAATGPVALPDLAGTVGITGTAKVGETLTANTDSLGGTGTISYQWAQGDTATGTFADISGATNETYTLTAADQGKYVRATASRAGHSGAISSAATGPVEALPPLTGTVSVTGTAKEAETLTANTDSLGGTGTISYRWERGDTTDGTFTPIPGATRASYTLTAADSDKYVRVTASRAGHSGAISSAASGPVEGLPPLTGTVSLTGTPEVGEVLTADTGSLDGDGAISYLWQRGNTETGAFANIAEATSETYTPVAADSLKYIRVTASRTGYSGTISSEPLKIPGGDGEFEVVTWIADDGTLLSNAPEDFIVISKSAQENLTVTAAAGLGNIRWRLNGTELSALRDEQAITIEAASYIPGFYNLSMYAERTGVPYQINITFVVDN
jgi:uncharacterized repeat protein (TIGR02543 family)